MDLKKRVTNKRRSRKDINLFKALTGQTANASKDFLQLLKDKILDDASSTWYKSELLYAVQVTKKRSSAADNNSSTVATSSNAAVVPSAPHMDSRHSRYLVIVKKTDSQNNQVVVTMLRVFRKDEELEIKQIYLIEKMKSIDYGNEDHELIFSFEQADYSFYFMGQLERDETLWITSQIFKAATGSDLTIGYSVDIDALSYLMTTSGSVGRFPLLQKLISQNSAHVGDRFSADEAEAEQILEQLEWSKSLSAQANIHEILSQRSTQLNDEIIDFLLQWEEMDEGNSQDSNAMSKTSKAAPGKASSIANKVFGLRDTQEVLRSLKEVDEQLGGVDRWLGDQIDRLSAIQSDLRLIEDESGALETSWQNLNVVQEIITLLVSKYSLEEGQEELLQYPERALGPLLKSPTLSSVTRQIAGLVEASSRLREAVTFRTSEGLNLSAAQWRQIQGMAAVTTQKKKLQEISDIFCSKAGDFLLALFDWLLKHKALLEGNE
eukprot:gene39663-48288_t